MKKLNIIHLLAFLFLFLLSNCKTTQQTVQLKNEAQQAEKTAVIKEQPITLVCEMVNCKKDAPMNLYQFDGYEFSIVHSANADSNQTFTFEVPASKNQFYFLGQAPNQTKPIILGTEKNLMLQGRCNSMRKSAFANSPLNSDYESAINSIRGYQSMGNSLNRQYAKAGMNAELREEALAKLKNNDAAQLSLLNDMTAKYPFVGKIVATKVFLSYANHKDKAANEIDYYLTEVFAHLDLKDPDLDRMPALFETFRDYTNTLVAIKMDKSAMKVTLDNILNQMNSESQAYRFALGSIVQSLKAKNHPAFTDYANLFVEKYEKENKPYIQDLKKSMADAKNFMLGAVAPDFEQNTPEGKPMKLSDLRGKVVLVDFWASWCGPCRKENPNVVKLYDKYKARGFEVLGVSLDKTKDKWVKAIEKDGLTWSHISDLKGWSNGVAKQYSVRSIPHTILLDKDGKILARNLRGPGLEMKLKEIFGE